MKYSILKKVILFITILLGTYWLLTVIYSNISEKTLREYEKLPTDSSVRKIMLEAQLQFVTEGETKDAFAFGRGRDKTFAEAVEAGRGDEWLPDVTGDEEKKIKSELRKLGRDLTESNIRAYKKHVTLKIPWSGNQYE